jgi:hypothetical protein
LFRMFLLVKSCVSSPEYGLVPSGRCDLLDPVLTGPRAVHASLLLTVVVHMLSPFDRNFWRRLD